MGQLPAEAATSSGSAPDRAAVLAEEKQRNRQLADNSDTFAVFLALDVQAWRLVRITLSAKALDTEHPGRGYQVLYLAQGVAR